MQKQITATVQQQASPFDTICRLDENGKEYWLARDLMKMLGYAKWQMFEKCVETALENLEASGCNVSEHSLLLELNLPSLKRQGFLTTRN